MKIYWHESSKNIIGPKLKELRKQHGLSQEKLASLLQLQGLECNDLKLPFSISTKRAIHIQTYSIFMPDM